MDSPQGQISINTEDFHSKTKERSDELMNYFLVGYFIVGLVLANFYGTWIIAIGLGGLLIAAFYAVKLFFPHTVFYQYVLSAILGVFMAQFIYQMHGMFEMHFFAFIGSVVLITYQKWTLQIPILIVVIVHHATFSYLHNMGIGSLYFISSDYFKPQTFIIYVVLTTIIFFICGLWGYQLKKMNERYISQTLLLIELQREAQLSNERKIHADVLKKLNSSLETKARELSRSNDELEQFAYVASHDLQEPLRMITSFLSLLQERYDSIIDDEGRQYIHFATDGAQRMRQIINDLLEFSRVGRAEDKLEQVDIQKMVTGITVLFKQRIAELNAQVKFDGLPVLQVYKAPIRQVFHNLISNALKYHSKGTVPEIEITCEEMGDFWKFSVIDNGIGISKEYFEQIFVIFKRLHARSEFPGTGIGLAITKKIIEFLGGEITVDSEKGKGSIFSFTIPKIY
ncbi:MAG: ATP-binding protein [Pedobacter sp.]|nr:ATP-binding protein [Pedobacter sp.]MDQ8052308.1 ATP-binding protein [Pedobacter sp.]